MLRGLHGRPGTQLGIGLLIGICFGFLLHKGGATHYDVIIGQLLFTDFTVIKIMMTAALTGMMGVHLLGTLGLVRLHPKPGSVGSTLVGGLIFGVGFGVLGYCPGTVAGAVGRGALDALCGGVVGMLIGAGLLAALYPALEKAILSKGDFADITLPELLKVNAWVVAAPLAAGIAVFLWWLERAAPWTPS